MALCGPLHRACTSLLLARLHASPHPLSCPPISAACHHSIQSCLSTSTQAASQPEQQHDHQGTQAHVQAYSHTPSPTSTSSKPTDSSITLGFSLRGLSTSTQEASQPEQPQHDQGTQAHAQARSHTSSLTSTSKPTNSSSLGFSSRGLSTSTRAAASQLEHDQGTQAHTHSPTSSTSGPTDTTLDFSLRSLSPSEREDILAARRRVFGDEVDPRERTGRRQLARKLQGAELASWYYNPPTVPGIHNEERE